MAVRLNNQLAIFNVSDERESSLMDEIASFIGNKTLMFLASASYQNSLGTWNRCVFFGVITDAGEITYQTCLDQPRKLWGSPAKSLPEIWHVTANTWSIHYEPEEGITLRDNDEKICTIRCEDDEILYDVLCKLDTLDSEKLSVEPPKNGSTEKFSSISESQVCDTVDTAPLSIEDWLVQQFSMMPVEQILQSIDEWSTEVLREVYQYELSGRSRPKVLSKVIEYLGYVGEDPRTSEPESFQQVDTQLAQKAVYGIDLDWDAVVIDRVEYILYKIDRTSDGGRTWDYIMTTDLVRYTDESATSGIEYLYRITPYNGTSPASSPVYRSPSMPFLGKIPEDIKQRNAKVLSRDKGTLQVHCPYCGVFTEKEISSNRKMNRAIENTNRANKLAQKAQQRQRKAEKFIAFGERMSFSAEGNMIANQIETNHMIQDQLRGSPANALRHLVNDAEVQCRNCARTVNEI